LACRHLPVEPEASDELAGGGFDPGQLAAGSGSGAREVLLVGHEPDLSDAIARATGAAAKMKKGGLAGLDEETLHALLRPADLAAIAEAAARGG
jgi:hypothetical protein